MHWFPSSHPRAGPASTSSPVSISKGALLPETALRKIFSYLAPDNHEYETLQRPVVLSLVCKQWQSVAYDHSRLWTFIAFHFNPQSLNTEASRLLRTKDQPIELLLQAGRKLTDYEVSTLIMPNVDRIRSLAIQIDERDLLTELWLQIPLKLPILKCFSFSILKGIEISATRVDDSQPFDIGPLVIPSGPFIYAWNVSALSSLTLHFARLGTFTTSLELLQVLSYSSQTLKHLELYGDGPKHDIQPSSMILTLPKLSSLVIGYFHSDSFVKTVQHMRLPNLQSLSLRCLRRCPDLHDPPARSFPGSGSEPEDICDRLLPALFGSCGPDITEFHLYGVSCSIRTSLEIYGFLGQTDLRNFTHYNCKIFMERLLNISELLDLDASSPSTALPTRSLSHFTLSSSESYVTLLDFIHFRTLAMFYRLERISANLNSLLSAARKYHDEELPTIRTRGYRADCFQRMLPACEKWAADQQLPWDGLAWIVSLLALHSRDVCVIPDAVWGTYVPMNEAVVVHDSVVDKKVYSDLHATYEKCGVPFWYGAHGLPVWCRDMRPRNYRRPKPPLEP